MKVIEKLYIAYGSAEAFMKYLFTNILGSFVFDANLNVVDKILFKSVSEYEKREIVEKKLKKKHQSIKLLPEEMQIKVLSEFKNKQYFQEFHSKNLVLTKWAVKNSITEDQLIIQAIANVNELDKVSNLLTKRLREWYSLYLPELSRHFSHHEKFILLILEKTRTELLPELHLSEEETMGVNLDAMHVEEMKMLAVQIKGLYELRQKHEDYLRTVMKKYCPNILELAGATIGARLLEMSGGLKRIAMLPASTIQLLGAEKALFRHIKSGSRSPKYGVIFSHPFIQKAKAKERGKVARALADKLSLCARLDYFKGEFKAQEYKEELEKRFLT